MRSADAFGDLFEQGFEARGFLLREGDDGDGAFDVGDGGIADGFPVAGAGFECAFEVAHDLLRGGGFGAGAQQRVDELGEGVPGCARRGLAVVAEEQSMDVRELIGLLGCERWAEGFLLVRVGEEVRHGCWMLEAYRGDEQNADALSG